MSVATGYILTINTGSSSLKAGVYRATAALEPVLAAAAERLGARRPTLAIVQGQHQEQVSLGDAPASHETALRALFAWLARQGLAGRLIAAGHRIVHGGPQFSQPQIITPALVETLQTLTTLDPNHLPQALAAVHTLAELQPDLPAVACFDTAFHRDMPSVAKRYPLPVIADGTALQRYGFHGLSCESIVRALRQEAGAAIEGRLIIAHLGSGASMTAVFQGRSVDTTMGFTPTGGLMMGTRSGDLDPGVLLYLASEKGMNAAALSYLVNQRAGLLGVSGSSADLRDLLSREATDPRAAEAIELFSYTAKKFLGALCAVLGGMETLVFTGGIGEHAAPVRSQICEGLGFLGIELDPQRNATHAPIISSAASRVTVRVMRTDEDAVIARHTYVLVGQP